MSVNAQDILKIREVFDYEIGDEFQFTSSTIHYPGEFIPQNADRIKIIGKYYSSNNDSLFYIRFHDLYTTILTDSSQLEYHFWTRNDTVYFVNLDSLITSYDTGFQISGDPYITTSIELCDSMIVGYDYWTIQNDFVINEYGKGLGHTYAFYKCTQGSYTRKDKLFYYKKGGIACGIPDLTTVGIEEPLKVLEDFFIYPNPVESTFTLQNTSQQHNFQCNLHNSFGQIIMTMELSGETNKINLCHIKRGIYYLSIKTDNKTSTIKLIKE